MGKFKKIFGGIVLGASIFTMTGVVTALNNDLPIVMAATTSYPNGTATVSTKTNPGDTKVWDFTANRPGSNTTLKAGDDVSGVVALNANYASYTDKNGVASKSSSLKSNGDGLSIYAGGQILVPVSSATDAGKVTFTGSANSDRYINLYDNEGAISSTKAQNTSPLAFDFTSDNIVTQNGNYYVKFEASNANGAVDTSATSSGEMKAKTITVLLTSGSYGEASVQYDVTYKDGLTTLKTEKVTDGDNATYIPTKYGYNFAGWYKDAELTEAAGAITEAITLYAKWTAWGSSFVTNANALTNEDIDVIRGGLGSTAITADLELAPSIFTMKSGVAMTTTNITLPNNSTKANYSCFNTSGANAGLTFTAPADGTFKVCVGAGGGSARNAKFVQGSTEIEPTTGDKALTADYAAKELTYTVEAGKTYGFGGSNGVRIYYCSFEEAAATESVELVAQKDVDVNTNAVRFIAKITCEDLSKLSSIALKLNVTKDSNTIQATTDFTTTTVYTAITDLAGFDTVEENVYYAIFELTDILEAKEHFADATLNGVITITCDGTDYTATLATGVTFNFAD